MLKDADFKCFPAVYVVCGCTDMRCGIDSLAAIIERKYKVSLAEMWDFFDIKYSLMRDYHPEVTSTHH